MLMAEIARRSAGSVRTRQRRAVAPVLTGLKSTIVTATPVSLYVKYSGKPTVTKIVDDAVAGLLADTKVSPFFAVIGKPGHDSVARLKSCPVLQFSALLGGPYTYPGTNDNGDMCESMKTAHAGLNITSAAFGQFVTDLAGVLKADGMSDADIQIVAPAVVGLKADIVTK